MYYYIFDIKKCKKRSQVEDIKNHLGSLGISGEFTYPTAAQNAEELVDLGLSKKYTTIVAIGGEEIINSISSKFLGRSEALGIIPMDASRELSCLIGVSNWKEAAEALRYRKISEIRLGQTASGQAFLTHAHLDIFNPVDVTIEFKDSLVQGRFRSLTIANYFPEIRKIGDDWLDIIGTSANPADEGFFKKIGGFFVEKKEEARSLSIFRARSLRLFTKTPMSLLSGGKLLAKTPQLIESSDEKIRLITARKSPLFKDKD